MNLPGLGRRTDEDVEHLLVEVERTIRSEISERESEQTINAVLSRARDAVREVVTRDDQPDDANALIGEVQLAIRSVTDIEKVIVDPDTLTDRISRTLHDAIGGWRERAGAVGRSVGGRIKSTVRRGGDRARTRSETVMCRVDSESLKHMDQLIEAGLAASRSAAASILIDAGIKARSHLFEAIEQKMDSIRAAKAELERMKEELEHEVEN